MTQLHSEKDAIKQAVEAGWVPQGYDSIIPHPIKAGIKGDSIILQGKGQEDGWEGWQGELKLSEFNFVKALQDPAFWQALGEARGWDADYYRKACPIHGTQFYDPGGIESEGEGGPACTACPVDGDDWEAPALIEEWQYHALRYFEQKLSGASMENYWQSLP